VRLSTCCIAPGEKRRLGISGRMPPHYDPSLSGPNAESVDHTTPHPPSSCWSGVKAATRQLFKKLARKLERLPLRQWHATCLSNTCCFLAEHLIPGLAYVSACVLGFCFIVGLLTSCVHDFGGRKLSGIFQRQGPILLALVSCVQGA
jgi:hypothetical protein